MIKIISMLGLTFMILLAVVFLMGTINQKRSNRDDE